MRLWQLSKFFYDQRIRGFDPPGRPHLDDETLARLTAELKRCRSYLEFGSGGSTLLADSLGIPTISVESDRFYARTVRSALKGTSVAVVAVDIGITAEWGWPLFKRRTPSRIRRWRQYVEAGFARVSPDLIMIDGRFRVACGLAAGKHTEGATVIFDDYYDRPAYRAIERYLGPPERVGRAAVFVTRKSEIPESAISDAIADPA